MSLHTRITKAAFLAMMIGYGEWISIRYALVQVSCTRMIESGMYKIESIACCCFKVENLGL